LTHFQFILWLNLNEEKVNTEKAIELFEKAPEISQKQENPFCIA
jgi:hypothetical protein